MYEGPETFLSEARIMNKSDLFFNHGCLLAIGKSTSAWKGTNNG